MYDVGSLLVVDYGSSSFLIKRFVISCKDVRNGVVVGCSIEGVVGYHYLLLVYSDLGR